MLRIGFGYDLHRLKVGGHIVIGGENIASEVTTIAHSDGDVLLHALIDSLVSPLGIGDIGKLFPDTDDKYKNISSLVLLQRVAKECIEGVSIINIDAVVIVDTPKILPYIAAMKQNIADVLNISAEQVGIKGKTSEKTRPDTIEAYVVSLLDI